MTIVASVTVDDAIVIGADSQTTFLGSSSDGQPVVMQSYQHAQKIHQIGKLAVGAWGSGNIGLRSVGSVLSEFAEGHESQSVQKTAESLSDHLNTLAVAAQESGLPEATLGAIVCGYSKDSEFAETWEISVPENGSPTMIVKPSDCSVHWHGVPGIFARLINGIDPALHELSMSLVDPDSKEEWESAIQLSRGQYISYGMPVQDAIDLTTFILEITIGASRFLPGAPPCGGPLWVAVITKRGGFKWIERPEWKVT